MFILKVGGGDKNNWNYVAEDLAGLWPENQFVIVHGANALRDRLAADLGKPTKTITSPSGIASVYTDERDIEIFLMSYAGLANKRIVAVLQNYGLPSVGLSGVDGKLWLAELKGTVPVKEEGKVKLLKGNRTGKVVKINSELINLLLDKNYMPVLCPPAITQSGEIVNTDNDAVLAILASALGADTIISLFEAPGLLKNASDENSLISHISGSELNSALEFAQGRMKRKILGARDCLAAGAKKIYWGDGRIKRPISTLLAGKGTIIEK